MVKNKKGISLIVLIITIIVIIILASVVVITFNTNNPIGMAREAKFKSDLSGFRDELMATHNENEISDPDYIKEDVNVDAGNYSEMKEYIPDITEEYAKKLYIKEGKLMYVSSDQEGYVSSESEYAKQIGINTADLNSDIPTNALKYYGKIVNYTPINGCNVGWKIFYHDGENIFLIADKCVPNSYLSNLGLSKNGDYGVYDEAGALAFEEKLNNTSYFEGFKDKYGKAESATGAPRLEMLCESWNAKGYTQLFYTSKNYGKEHYIGTSSDPTGLTVMMTEKDDLYFPSTEYWLAAPSNLANLMWVESSGFIGCYRTTEVTGSNNGLRIVVKLKSNVKLVEKLDGTYDLI